MNLTTKVKNLLKTKRQIQEDNMKQIDNLTNEMGITIEALSDKQTEVKPHIKYYLDKAIAAKRNKEDQAAIGYRKQYVLMEKLYNKIGSIITKYTLLQTR